MRMVRGMMGIAAAQIVQTDFAVIKLFMIAMLLPKAVIILLCLWVLAPRLLAPQSRDALYLDNRFSWLALTGNTYDASAHADFMRTSEASQLIISVARANAATSQVLLRKFHRLRLVFIIAAADVLMMVIGFILFAG